MGETSGLDLGGRSDGEVLDGIGGGVVKGFLEGDSSDKGGW